MKLFFIKIGKLWNVLRRDGLMRGGQRVLAAVRSAREMRRVAPGDILFITNGVGDSARYRARHVAEELILNGFRASVTAQDNPRLLSYADTFRVFIFHRVLYTENIRKTIEKIKKREKEIIFEADDLVHDPAFLPHMAGYELMNSLERKLYENGLGREIVEDPYVRAATTTTSYLARKLREKDKKVFVVTNKLAEEDRLMAEGILPKATKDVSVVTLCYLSGTASHNRDFATITEPLLALLAKHQNLRLLVAGPLDLDPAFERFRSQVRKQAFVPWREHFEIMAQCDINLAPLEIGNPFCEGKSELKFFEAGIVKVPTVASATETFREAITDGVDGFAALSKGEWQDKLEKLILDAELRLAMGRRARETALSRYTTKNGKSPEYYQYLREKIGKQ